jgi:hypothetical protein
MPRHNPSIKAPQIFRPRWLRASMPEEAGAVQRVCEPVGQKVYVEIGESSGA